ncbi:MAG: macro domain-containing protein [bacterium]|nr:macro domain-containing protein [bacterium]
MEIIKGNLIELAKQGRFDVIVHGCNCMCTMDAGIAKQIKNEFPEAYTVDLQTIPGDKTKLGTCSYGVVSIEGKELHIVNAYTQYDWKGGSVLVDYNALRSCMKLIKQKYAGRKIGIPKIGAGLAGGDWEKISAIIAEEFKEENFTLVIKEEN